MIRFLVGLVLWYPLCLLRGWAIVKLWDWFVEPQFPNLWHPTIYSAVGIAMVIGVLSPLRIPPPTEEGEKNYPYWHTTGAIVYPLMAVGFGWVWHSTWYALAAWLAT